MGRSNIQNGQLPPQAIDLEEAVLGALLLDSTSDKAQSIMIDLNPQHFYKEAHQKIADAIMKMNKKGENIDILTITNYLNKTDHLEYIGGAYYITKLTNRVSSAANIEAHYIIIKEMYIKRKIISDCSQLIEDAYDNTSDALLMIDELEKKTTKLTGNIITSRTATSKELLQQVLEKSEKIRQIEGVVGVPSGLQEVDKITGGWQPSDLIILAARPGMGKGLVINELIKTPTGNKKIRDLKIGDWVCNTSMGKCKVIGIYPQGKRPVYEITFDDGLKVKADDQHLWKVQDRKIRKKGSDDVRVLSTTELLKEGLYVNNTNRKNFSIKVCEPALHNMRKTPIDPYILGCLIGDGTLSEKNMGLGNPEKDIIQKFKSYFGDKFKEGKDGINHRINKCNLHKQLKKLGLLNKLSFEKFIPENYLFNSFGSRIELLRGLLDTDGTVDKYQPNRIEYSTTSEQLKKDIMTLVRGLGGRCSYGQRVDKYKKNSKYIETRINYRIYISFGNNIIPVSSKKHTDKFKSGTQFNKRFITDIKYKGEEETICIKVNSKDECFLINDYLVTHNTSLALKWIVSPAEQGIPTGIFSLEMSNLQLFSRIISQKTEIPLERVIRTGMRKNEEQYIIDNYKDELDKLPIYFDDTPGISSFELRNKARKWKREKGIKLLVIDYLQLMTARDKKEYNRENEISEISRNLKGIAKELDIPVIALSQLSRAVETRAGDKIPQLSDLRESGSIEQDADAVVFLYRPEYYGITEDADGYSTIGKAEVKFAKHRNGSLATALVKFDAEKVNFMDYKDEPTPLPELGDLPVNKNFYETNDEDDGLPY